MMSDRREDGTALPEGTGVDRTEWMRRFIDGEHFRYRRFRDDGPAPQEVALDDGWAARTEADAGPVTKQAAADFRVFCERCLGVRLRPGGGGPGGRVAWRLKETGPRPGRPDARDPLTEAFRLSVEEDAILIEAAHERGLLHGTHYLERQMADRGGPWVERGAVERRPRFTPRISNSIFIESDQQVTDPDQFSDACLSLMSHFGANGIHLMTCLWDFFRSDLMPELNADGLPERIEQLRALNERTLRYGIDLYVCLVTHPLPGSHPVFAAHPGVRGARIDTLQTHHEFYCPCSAQERTLGAYEEAFRNLFEAAPELAGAICIFGGEGFYHCYTRPLMPYRGQSSCPHCAGLDPSEQVARLANRLGAAVTGTDPSRAFYAWPYSAFTWSGEDRAQIDWIRRLEDHVAILSNFDTGGRDPCLNGDVCLYDYNIRSIGPGEMFQAQAAEAAAQGRPIYAKVESNTTPTIFFLPYLPVHDRWHRRFQAMGETGVHGYIGQWRFYGMNGSPPEELQYHAIWNPERDTRSLLAAMARRDFRLDDRDADTVIEAWIGLGRAWEAFPYSAFMAGERECYFRGPVFLGPAHPMIWNVQDSYGLPKSFFPLRGDLIEGGMIEDEAIQKQYRRPAYVSELALVLPFGVDRCLEQVARCRSQWHAGVEALRGPLAASPSERARMELDVCETIDIHLASVEHVIRFYQLRDDLWRQPQDKASFCRAMEKARGLLTEEIENAERMLPILGRDPRIGYIHCYGDVYDLEKVEAKIAQCRFVRDKELPDFSRRVRFHLWMEFP